jgi:histidyl-tRNA synthetase
VERLLLACDAEGCFPVAPRPADAFVIDLTGGEQARDLVDELRRSGLTALRAYDGRSPKSQMKQADKSGARFAVIIGPDELAEGVVSLRPLRDDGGQESVGRPDIVARLWQLSNEGPIEG